MSTLTKFNTLYEILLRFDESGALKGAHAQYLEGIAEDGVIIQAKPCAAIPLSLAAKADVPTLKSVLGTAAAALLTAKETAEADATAARAEFEAKDATAQALLAQVADLEAALAAKA